MDKPCWVYILLCENGAYYTGYTTDLERRYAEHLAGTAKCKYTRSFKPIKIARSWQVENSVIAKRLEQHIKKLSRAEKEKIVLMNENDVLSVVPHHLGRSPLSS